MNLTTDAALVLTLASLAAFAVGAYGVTSTGRRVAGLTPTERRRDRGPIVAAFLIGLALLAAGTLGIPTFGSLFLNGALS